MRRLVLAFAALLAATGLSACSKCDVPTFGAMACKERPSVR
jgi:hypothetical protein